VGAQGGSRSQQTPTQTGEALTEVLKKMGGDPDEAKRLTQGKVIQGGGVLMWRMIAVKGPRNGDSGGPTPDKGTPKGDRMGPEPREPDHLGPTL
jgi:hypothetical protein